MVHFKVNGSTQSFDGDPEMPLLWYLRDILGLTGTKFGCGMGAVRRVHGAGKRQGYPILPTQMGNWRGAEITTIEGISTHGPHAVQKAWAAVNVPQCGYCQTGQIMQAISLLSSKPHPTDADIDAVMSGNICRCGTYQRIRAAIKEAAKETGMITLREDLGKIS